MQLIAVVKPMEVMRPIAVVQPIEVMRIYLLNNKHAQLTSIYLITNNNLSSRPPKLIILHVDLAGHHTSK